MTIFWVVCRVVLRTRLVDFIRRLLFFLPLFPHRFELLFLLLVFVFVVRPIGGRLRSGCWGVRES